jgi:serine/threonine-protein phosphatase 2A regulatory subunit B'
MKPSTQKNVPSNQIKSPQVSTTTSTGSSATKSLAQSIAKYNDPKQVPKEYKDQFIKKIQFCCITYDFNEESRQVKEKNERLAYLQEFTELVNDQNCLTAIILPNLEIVIEMIEKNIFRPLPILKKAPPPSEGMNAAEEDDILIDPSWAHFQPIYEFFLQLISKEAIDVKSLKGFITHSFIQEFLDLFDAEEPREREYLKNILHRLYAKLVPRRKMIRKAMNDSFHSLIHESVKFNGAPELLDILASIISGFAVPLREEHIIFFKTIIIPLHKVQSCYLYHENIVRASMLFLSKDPNLSINLVEGLLKYWPFANSAKEMMFLNEILEVLEVCEITKLEPLINKLFKRLIKCIAGSHLQVADRAMCFFENDYFLTILKTYRQITFPLLVPVIATIAENHWHKVLQESLNALKTILKEIDYQAFDKALQQKENSKCMYLVQDPKVLKKERSKVDDKWKILSKQAQSKNPSFKEPTGIYNF